MNGSTFWMIKYMNGSVFSKARYMNGVGFKIMACTPLPHLPTHPLTPRDLHCLHKGSAYLGSAGLGLTFKC